MAAGPLAVATQAAERRDDEGFVGGVIL